MLRLFEYEMQWLVEHGWNNAEVGVLRAGCRADFVGLGRDPFDAITAVLDVRAFYRDGTAVFTGCAPQPDTHTHTHTQRGLSR